ncbi:MAG: MFS transporter [Pontixanthobacter sp.]
METKRQSYSFLSLYALAAAGGAIAYVPFLTILLPMRVAAISGSNDVAWLAYVTFAGALTASVSNIVFGWLSDVSGNRKYWVLAGLLCSSALLTAMARAETVEALIVMIIFWQVTLNMMLSPLAAWAGDCVPDNQKGMLGGLLAFSPAMGAIAATFVTIPGLASGEARLLIVAGLVILFVLPVILFGAPRKFPELFVVDAQVSTISRHIIIRMWAARLLIQISEAALFAFLYFWFTSIDAGISDSSVSRIFSAILVASVPVAMIVGRWADRTSRPIIPLPISAAFASLGLLAMALSTSLETAIAGYVIFGLASAIFLALHTSQTLRVLPKPERRGRDLGIFNLTNTGPSLVVPWLTIALVPLFGFSGLFVLLAGLACLASLLLIGLVRLR